MTLLDPRVYRAIEILARDAISFSGNSPIIRSAITALKNELTISAEKRTGTISPEISLLDQLLRRTLGDTRPPIRLDILDILESSKAITPAQASAGRWVRKVWAGFERFLVTGARSYEPTGGHSSAPPLGPYEVLGEALHIEWRDIWTPWHKEASHRLVKPTSVRHVNIVLRVLVDGASPTQLDDFFKTRGGFVAWEKGMALNAFCFEMNDLLMRGLDELGD